MSGPALLIDARNTIYRAVYGVKSGQRDGVRYHAMTLLLKHMSEWVNILQPSSVHVFWDAPRHTVWRKSILAKYKTREQSNYVGDLSADMATTTEVAHAFFEKMGIRQYERPNMEADDLIYTAVSVLHPTPTIIVSSDSDMLQIPYRYSSSSVMDPKSSQILPVPKINPVHLKAIKGDTADSIDGYAGIGPVKGAALLENRNLLREYFSTHGSAIFNLNLLLIDLSLCPKLLSNTIYVQKILSEPVAFDRDAVYKLISTHKVNGLHQDFVNYIMPFKDFQ